MRTRAGIFGHNAPAFRSLTEAAQAAFVDWDAGSGLPVWQDSRRDSNGAVVGYYREADCLLDRVVPGITGDGWAVLERPPRQYTPFRVVDGRRDVAGRLRPRRQVHRPRTRQGGYGRGPGRQRHRQEPGVHHAYHDGPRPERSAGARPVADRGAARPRHRRGHSADARSDGAAAARGAADRRHRRTGGPARRDDERGRDTRAGRACRWLHDAAFRLARAHVHLRPADGHAQCQRRPRDARRARRRGPRQRQCGAAGPALLLEEAAADVYERRQCRPAPRVRSRCA